MANVHKFMFRYRSETFRHCYTLPHPPRPSIPTDVCTWSVASLVKDRNGMTWNPLANVKYLICARHIITRTILMVVFCCLSFFVLFLACCVSTSQLFFVFFSITVHRLVEHTGPSRQSSERQTERQTETNPVQIK